MASRKRRLDKSASGEMPANIQKTPESPLPRIRDTLEGAIIAVKAQPGSRKNEFRGVRDGHLVVAVTAIAESGKANDAIIRFLADKLDIAKSRIQVIAGATSTRKSIFLSRVKSADLHGLLPYLAETRSDRG